MMRDRWSVAALSPSGSNVGRRSGHAPGNARRVASVSTIGDSINSRTKSVRIRGMSWALAILLCLYRVIHH